jgi:hypothetical protein
VQVENNCTIVRHKSKRLAPIGVVTKAIIYNHKSQTCGSGAGIYPEAMGISLLYLRLIYMSRKC